MIEDETTTVYTTEEVAARLRIHINTVRKLIATRQLGASLVGKNFRISEAQIREYLERNTIQPK